MAPQKIKVSDCVECVKREAGEVRGGAEHAKGPRPDKLYENRFKIMGKRILAK